jgi:4-hydroxy-tetrahydrodipicolinate reductase
MSEMTILGDGPLGRAVEVTARQRGDEVHVLGRPAAGRHRLGDFVAECVVVEASRGESVVSNLAAALDAGCRRFVVATTGWTAARADVEALLREHDAAAVAAANFSIGVVLFGRLVEAAVGLFGPVDAFDPYLLEWHRRSKRDRPSGTAADLARRIEAYLSELPRVTTAMADFSARLRARSWDDMAKDIVDTVCQQ